MVLIEEVVSEEEEFEIIEKSALNEEKSDEPYMPEIRPEAVFEIEEVELAEDEERYVDTEDMTVKVRKIEGFEKQGPFLNRQINTCRETHQDDTPLPLPGGISIFSPDRADPGKPSSVSSQTFAIHCHYGPSPKMASTKVIQILD